VDPRTLTSKIESGQFSPLYLFVGEETFMIDETVAKLREKVLSEGLSDFNLNIFYAADCDIEQVRDAVETLPMMAQRRLVILKQCQDLSASELESLTPLVEKPVDTAVFVMVGTKADMRKKFFKLFESNGDVVKFQRPFENQINPWIQYIAKKNNLVLSAEAMEILKEWVGPNLSDINNEMTKLSQYLGDRTEVTPDDIRQVVSQTRIETVFELVNCMGRRDCAGSFMHLAHLLDSGQNEIGVLAMTIRHFRILLLCQEALKEGLSQAQIASRVGVHGFFIKEYIEQAKLQDSKKLLQIYDILLDTDRALKSNPLSSHLWLENLVLQACQQLPA
jgi:DNA polymerase III subunit delta